MVNRTNSFPIELITDILRNSDIPTIKSAMLLCSFWNRAAQNTSLWYQILCKELNKQYIDSQSATLACHPKDIYKSILHLKRIMTSFPDTYRNISLFLKKHAASALMLACLDDNLETFAGLSTASQNQNNDSFNVNEWLDFACAYGAKSVVKHLISLPGARQPDDKLLRFAVGSGNKFLVESILSPHPGLSINEVVLEYAKYSGNHELIGYLNSIINHDHTNNLLM